MKNKGKARKARGIWFSLMALCLCVSVALVFAATTNFTEPFPNGHGWTYTQASCSGGATCTSGDVAGDGNPSPSVFAKIAGRNKSMSGYFSRSFTWEQLGVPTGDNVQTVDGNWDDKAVQTAVACSSSSTMGMEIFDSTNTSPILASTLEPTIDVSGDTAAWTNHNPTGAAAVNTGSKASTTTLTLRFNINPASGNNGSAACELRGDNYKLTIESTTPSGRNRVVMISRRF
jgi:hypothetical protein